MLKEFISYKQFHHCPEGPVRSAMPNLGEPLPTLQRVPRRSSELYADRPCLGERATVDGVAQPFEFLTYKESATAVADIAAGYAKVRFLKVSCTQESLDLYLL